MKQWLSIFSAVLVAGALIYGWSRRITLWETGATTLVAKLNNETAMADKYRYALPDKEAAQTLVIMKVRLELLCTAAADHLQKIPMGATGEPELRAAMADAIYTRDAARQDLALPGNALVAESLSKPNP